MHAEILSCGVYACFSKTGETLTYMVYWLHECRNIDFILRKYVEVKIKEHSFIMFIALEVAVHCIGQYLLKRNPQK
jgi:hypothetical protein